WEKDAAQSTLSPYNRTHEVTGYCCSMDWLEQLQQKSCPLLRLLVLGLMALPLYNAVLIVVGWRLNSSSKVNAERLLRMRPPITVKRQAPLPPPLQPPRPPPRHRRRRAPKLPLEPETWKPPNNSNPFGSLQRNQKLADEFLHRNLQLALSGLQRPVPLESESSELEVSIEALESPKPIEDRETPKARSKWLPTILKRTILHPISQRLGFRSSRKKGKNLENNAIAVISSSGNNSNSSFYVF
ncbi:hypothetical protein KR018_005376, partial [Drosophila ironensis]